MDINKKYEDYVKKCRMHPFCTWHETFVRTMVHKSRIDVTNLTDTQPSKCQLIVKGIEPQQHIDLCTAADHYTNLTLIDNPQSTQPSNAQPVSAGSGEFSITQQAINCGCGYYSSYHIF